MAFNSNTQLYAESLADVSALCEKVGGSQGGYYDIAQANGSEFLVMEFVEGEFLHAVVTARVDAPTESFVTFGSCHAGIHTEGSDGRQMSFWLACRAQRNTMCPA